MPHYSKERKEAALRKMMPPSNISISQLSTETGISEASLYNWRKQARLEGNVVPGDGKNSEQWSSEDKFSIVLKTATMNAAELAEYCRKNGLYVEQVEAWKSACLQANTRQDAHQKQLAEQTRTDKQTIKKLEKELNRKEKALAETAALLVLRKKADAIWGKDEDE